MRASVVLIGIALKYLIQKAEKNMTQAHEVSRPFHDTRQLSNETYRITLPEQTCKDFGLELVKPKHLRIVDLEHPLEDYVFVTPTDSRCNWFVSINRTFLEKNN